MIKSTKTLILLGAVTFSVSACDGDQKAPEAAATSNEASQDAAQEEVKVFRDAGELAICLTGCGDSHCAYAMGACLREASDCGGEEGCQENYTLCAEEFIQPACGVEDKPVEMKAALSCWNTFQGCLEDSDDSISCVVDLYSCADEGCGEEGCEAVEFSADDVFPQPEKFDPAYRP